MSNYSWNSCSVKFIHATYFNVFMGQVKYEAITWDPTPCSASFILFFPSPCYVPPTAQNKRYIHVHELAVAQTPCRNSWVLFPPSFQLLSTMSFMLQGENRRSACSIYPTMWRARSIFCAWTLLFLTEVCAQSQRRYIFISFLSYSFEWLLFWGGIRDSVEAVETQTGIYRGIFSRLGCLCAMARNLICAESDLCIH